MARVSIAIKRQKPEVPVPAAIVPPGPATTPSGAPGKVCYCVERSAEQQLNLIESLTEHKKIPPVGTALLSVAVSSRGASPAVIPSPTGW